ncbi:MAG: FKBP-type peptidyl-prolyl cis-trans isomerase [Alphaproteobacteria bacterium]|nr:FKBP-type peptidyl-prolyl cis-trans isomerase [Alphaproteobacteria bacterium]
MMRLLLVLIAAMALAGCQPVAKIDKDDPYASLHPWKPDARNVETLPSGVQYVVVSKGDGRGVFPAAIDEVEVHYDGRLAANGEQFDASYGGDPATFRLNQVIPGWTEGLQKMQVGDHFMFFIPAEHGYGEDGRPGIPPNSDLMFRVELLDVTQAKQSDAAAWTKATPWPTASSEVIRTASGLEYLPIRNGESDKPPATDRDYAIVHFEGRLDDGTVVESTFETQDPETFPIEQLTSGWAEALKLMRPGDRWMIRLPAHLLYAEEGDGLIPPGAAVTYEIDLEDVIVIDAPAEPAPPQ